MTDGPQGCESTGTQHSINGIAKTISKTDYIKEHDDTPGVLSKWYIFHGKS